MKDIFISYKSEDIEKARKVRDHLEKDGFSVWMAPDSITGGASYAAEIPPAIDGAKVFVLVFTKNTQGSKWVSRELDRAINNKLKDGRGEKEDLQGLSDQRCRYGGCKA